MSGVTHGDSYPILKISVSPIYYLHCYCNVSKGIQSYKQWDQTINITIILTNDIWPHPFLLALTAALLGKMRVREEYYASNLDHPFQTGRAQQ